MCICIDNMQEYGHAKSQKFLYVFVLRRYPALLPFFCTATQVHLQFSIKNSAVSNPFNDPPPRLALFIIRTLIRLHIYIKHDEKLEKFIYYTLILH